MPLADRGYLEKAAFPLHYPKREWYFDIYFDIWQLIVYLPIYKSEENQRRKLKMVDHTTQPILATPGRIHDMGIWV